MGKQKIRGKDLRKLGLEDSSIISLALEVFKKHFKYDSKEEKLQQLQNLLETPDAYLQDEAWQAIAERLTDRQKEQELYKFEEKPFRIYGEEHIASNAIGQMKNAMQLPVVVDGALMPDAHHGYGLPIGGVLATENAVIPYAVGIDIGCRMCLSVYACQEDFFNEKRVELQQILVNNSRFGTETFDDKLRQDDFFDRAEFGDLKLLQQLKDKAYQQIGSSGGGNHFVDFGLVEVEEDNELGLEVGKYLALLTHSGSRGFGAKIAQYYSKIARQKRQLPKELAHLSWLEMEEAEGQEYWLAMNMAGDYASACHHHIHQRIEQALGVDRLLRIENHHNFAWKDQLANGQEVFVHRKGATPAHQGELGIIPGSMTKPAFIVKGKGNPEAIFSASHGAGRLLSRQEAENSFTRNALNKLLKNEGIDLFGAGLDEAPDAYKDIHKVIAAQNDLVEVLGKFYPKIVRME
jgi:tRNA-splicing ligase RtcB